MNKKLTLHEKRDGKWRSLNLHKFTEKPVVREIWESMEGKEIVGKLEQDGVVKAYIAGTEELRAFYRTKCDKVLTWHQAADMIEQARAAIGDMTQELPFLQELCRVIPGTEIDHFRW